MASLRKHSCHSRGAPSCIMGAGGCTAKHERGKDMSHSAASTPVAPPPPIIQLWPTSRPLAIIYLGGSISSSSLQVCLSSATCFLQQLPTQHITTSGFSGGSCWMSSNWRHLVSYDWSCDWLPAAEAVDEFNGDEVETPLQTLERTEACQSVRGRRWSANCYSLYAVD